MCGSGATNGTNCGIVRSDSPVTLELVASRWMTSGTASAPFPSSTWIWGQGDSGGPIYRTYSSGRRDVVALISSVALGSAPATCPPGGGGAGTCASSGHWTPLNRVMDVLIPHGFSV